MRRIGRSAEKLSVMKQHDGRTAPPALCNSTPARPLLILQLTEVSKLQRGTALGDEPARSPCPIVTAKFGRFFDRQEMSSRDCPRPNDSPAPTKFDSHKISSTQHLRFPVFPSFPRHPSHSRSHSGSLKMSFGKLYGLPVSSNAILLLQSSCLYHPLIVPLHYDRLEDTDAFIFRTTPVPSLSWSRPRAMA